MDLHLQPNEGIIIQSANVLHGGMMASYTDELILTNLHIIYIKRGIFGGVKSVQKFHVDEIKIVHGQVQAIAGKNPINNCPQLQIYFKDGKETFEFQHSARKEIARWIHSINQLLICTDMTSNPLGNLNGTPQIAEAVRETIGAFKNAITGVKTEHVLDGADTAEYVASKTRSGRTSENVTIKCMGCMAPVSGLKGQRVHCAYCGTEQTL